MEELTGFSVQVGNDANVAALGEMWKGGGAGQKNMIMVTLGTGVGGGVIIGGKVIIGEHGAGGEIGHLCVNYEETENCGCGNRGCLEQYASATGIVRIAKKKLVSETRPTVLCAETVTAKDVFDAVKEGTRLHKKSQKNWKLSWICAGKSGGSSGSVRFCNRRRCVKGRRDTYPIYSKTISGTRFFCKQRCGI